MSESTRSTALEHRMNVDRFSWLFPRAALFLFGLQIPIIVAAALIIFSVEVEIPAQVGITPLPSWMSHIRVFTICLFLNAVSIVISSFAMIKEKLWGYSFFIFILSVNLLWLGACFFSVLYSIFVQSQAAFKLVEAVTALLPLVIMIIFCVYLLRMLVRSRSRFKERTHVTLSSEQ